MQSAVFLLRMKFSRRHIQQKMYRHRRLLLCVSIIASIAYYFCLPNTLFDDPVSIILEDRNGELLGARIAADGQWRFPQNDTVPEKFKKAIIAFEDKRFGYHPGIDPLAIFRAIRINLKNKRVVSGGSTLTMQVIRLSRKGKSRTLWEKCIEAVQATRLEWRCSKDEILALYASYAPFGGNVVGLDAAAWKYFGRSAADLSWAETATLAVLPNSPSLTHPGRNRKTLQRKRDFLLDKLAAEGTIDSLTHVLAKMESLPQRPHPFPNYAPHLLDHIQQQYLRQFSITTPHPVIKTTLDLRIQMHANEVVRRNYRHLKSNHIHNAAVLVSDPLTGEILAYVGNADYFGNPHGGAVDVIRAGRSSGSILKPLLYASMLNEGQLLPSMLVADIPTYYMGYRPKNFTHEHNGAIPAHQALARSLNIPAVRLLSSFGVEKFQDYLLKMGFSTLHRTPEEYGLPLILGGAEVNLWDLSRAYGGMVRHLHHFNKTGAYPASAYQDLRFILSKKEKVVSKDAPFALLDAGSIWHTFEAMSKVARPDVDKYWEKFSSSDKIAWKTGTSFGHRDAWALGCSPQYVVAVWGGNADGTGHPDLTGTRVAAPILFEVFDGILSKSSWFKEPLNALKETHICKTSGHVASPACPSTISQYIPRKDSKTGICPYHVEVHLDPSEKWQVNSSCFSPFEMKTKSFFILPPSMEWYYRRKNPHYQNLPPLHPDCKKTSFSQNIRKIKPMECVYPTHKLSIQIPRNLDGTLSSAVFEARHRDPDATIFWHLDGTYVGKTKSIHEKDFSPSQGQHTLKIVDQNGEEVSLQFVVFSSLK